MSKTLARNGRFATGGVSLALSAFILLLAGGSLPAADEVPVVTRHEATFDGGSTNYTAEAGRIPIRDMESGELRGRMFYVAYRLERDDDRPRPLLFSWGGGPSGPALGMHMTFGPKSVDDDGRVDDNALSLLSVADLVFVDPVGTGFSRAAKPEFVEEFYGTTGDARSVAEFVRVWIALHAAEFAPVFLTGQSYGVWRAGFAAELLERSGRRLDGLILTSGGMGMADEYASRPREIAHRVPDYAATAFRHGWLPDGFADSEEAAWQHGETWARETYGPALERIDTLTDSERETIAGELSRITGFPLADIDRETLTFTPPAYRRAVAGEDSPLNLFDMRRGPESDESGDPAVRDRAQARYLRGTLGYRTDLAYIGLETGYTPATSPDYRSIGWRWQYDTGDGEVPADGGPPGKEPWVRRAIDINPDLQVFVEAGVYDSLNFCAANEDRRRRMPAELADNFELHCYFAGHGSFRDPDAYPQVMRDIRAFIERVAE